MGLDPLVLVGLAVLLGAGMIWALLRVSPVSTCDAGMFGQVATAPPTALAPMAARLRATLDLHAPMALAAWAAAFAEPSRRSVTGPAALLSELLTFCQHAATRDDMIALADLGSSLSLEFDRWLGADLGRHLEVMALSHPPVMPPADPRLLAHARDHGWLAPSTLALARAGTPAPSRAEPISGAAPSQALSMALPMV